MNYFNKEELQEIHRCLKYMVKGGTTPYSNLTMELKNKLQFMMDKYDAQVIEAWHCEKCGHVQ